MLLAGARLVDGNLRACTLVAGCRHLRYTSIKLSYGSVAMGRRNPLMCYTRKDRDFEREARWITENRLMEEEARRRHEEHHRSREQEKKPLTEKVKELVGVK
jgi:hypothetical protein